MEQPQDNKPRPFNLNILPVLRELLRLRNVTQAASVLNMSQSAVSDALSRLRDIFDDKLLIPSGRGFVLSSKAMMLEPLLLESLHQIEALMGARAFDPAEASGRFQIAASDYASLSLGPPLVRQLGEKAPDLCVQFHDVDDESFAALLNGQLDLLVIPEMVSLPGEMELERRFLFDDELTMIRSSDPEVRGKDPASENWDAQNAILYSIGDSSNAMRAAIRQRFGEEDIETIVLPAFMLLPFFVENTGITAIVQRRLAERLLPAAKIEIIKTPLPLPKIRMFAVWARARNNDPLHRWLRELIIEIGADAMMETLEND